VADQKNRIALIPARGGSKGLPHKNIRLLGGKPLIAWTIEAAIQSTSFAHVVVSTDDPNIAGISKSFGAEVPFQRPAELAGDTAKSIDVIIQAMEWFENRGLDFEEIALLQPTSPLRNADDIEGAVAFFDEKKATLEARGIVSVCQCEHSPLWMNTLAEDLSMADFLSKSIAGQGRQLLKQYYRLNGAIYLANINYLKENNGFFGPKTYAYIMPQEKSVDIDTELDLQFAEFLMLKNHE
jgi:N-acylneuraminate cytidylyltransferase/CMP-N,N'-diacetyllegionaminic acid synthase